MSFSMTTEAVRNHTKTVTRRLGWANLEPGTLLWACEKCQGLKKGEKVVKIALIRVLRNDLEPLDAMYEYGSYETTREGFPGMGISSFIDMFIRANKLHLNTYSPSTQVINRIEFEYVDEEMARKVFVTSDMGIDEAVFAVAEESWQAAVLWPWILTALDDWGRGRSDARRIKKTMFPDWPGITWKHVDDALRLFAKHGLLSFYGETGEYMAADEESWRRWQTHIRWDRKGKAASKFPEPPVLSGNIPDDPGKASPSPSPSPSNPLTPLTHPGSSGSLDTDPRVQPLMAAAATVVSAKASWKPKQTDADMFRTLLERFQPVQLRDELEKFRLYALQREWTKFGRAFTNWMNRVEPVKAPPGFRPYVPEKPEEEPAPMPADVKERIAALVRGKGMT
jgi:hypothetical protein